MSRTVFILGAGASRFAGGPLMNDFLDKARDLHRSGRVRLANKDFELVFKAVAALDPLHAKANIATDNFEELFGLFEMASLCQRLGNFPPEEIPAVNVAIRRLIMHTLEQSIRLPVSSGKILAPAPYGDLVTLTDRLQERGLGPVSFITFNYDLALDFGFHKRGRHLNYCFPSDGTDGVQVMKLHGSLNWARCVECGQIAPWHLRQFFQNRDWGLSGEEKTLCSTSHRV